MKRITTLLSLLAIATLGFAQTPTKNISGDITANRTFDRDTIYIIDGFVFVKNNATLTIESGTIIKGIKENRATLIITRGSKIYANGTASQPIIFTSNEAPGNRNPGDWGGVVILGKAVINRIADCTTCPGSAIAANEPGVQNAAEGDIDNTNGDGLYGGLDNNDNSGSFTYVRIEYAGIIIVPGNEINGLTMAGVGRGTTINHVQVSYTNDDSYEWFGGCVNAKNLISVGAIDDDFDTDFGFSGKLQFGVAQRDSNNYDTGNSPTTNGFESNNDGQGTAVNPRTKAVFSNFTVVGPLANGQALAQGGSYNYGARIRASSQISIMNSVILGFPTNIYIDGITVNSSYLGDSLRIKNNISAGALTGNNSEIRSSISANDAAVKSKFETVDANDTIDSAAGILIAPFVYGAPNFFPTQNSPANSGAAFVDTTVSNVFFTPTTFRGAFGNLNGSPYEWDKCWANYNPQTVDYSFAPYNSANVLANFTVNQQQLQVTLTNTSTLNPTYTWDFGDGNTSADANPTHTYTTDGNYTITLVATLPCGSDTAIKQVFVTTGINEYANVLGVNMYPNPAQNIANINFNNAVSANVAIAVYDVTGKLIDTKNVGKLATGKQNIELNTAAYKNGLYMLRLTVGEQTQTIRLVIAK